MSSIRVISSPSSNRAGVRQAGGKINGAGAGAGKPSTRQPAVGARQGAGCPAWRVQPGAGRGTGRSSKGSHNGLSGPASSACRTSASPTLFNALTRTAAAQAANFPFCTIEPNVGEVAVPDARVGVIAEIAKSKVTNPRADDLRRHRGGS